MTECKIRRQNGHPVSQGFLISKREKRTFSVNLEVVDKILHYREVEVEKNCDS